VLWLFLIFAFSYFLLLSNTSSEGMLKNMAVHELAILVTFYGVTSTNIVSVVPDKQYSSCQVSTAVYFFLRMKQVLGCVKGKRRKIVSQRKERRMRWMKLLVMPLLFPILVVSIDNNHYYHHHPCLRLYLHVCVYIRPDHRQIYGFRQAGLHRDHPRGQESVGLRRPVNCILCPFTSQLLREA